MANSQPVPRFKVILLGDSGVGKTALFQQYVDSTFLADSISTIGVDAVVKDMQFRGRKLKLHLWDTAGQEKYRSIVLSHYRGAKAAILVYDVTRQGTFDNLTRWFEQLRTYTNVPPIMVVGNKMDLLETAGQAAEHPDIQARGQNFATTIGAFKHQTISAMNTEQVRSMFEDLVCEMLFNAYTTLEQEQANQTAVVIPTPQQTPASGCRC